MGGCLESGELLGNRLMTRALQVVDGKAVDDLPLNMKRPARFVFDYRLLGKHGISEERLPANSILRQEEGKTRGRVSSPGCRDNPSSFHPFRGSGSPCCWKAQTETVSEGTRRTDQAFSETSRKSPGAHHLLRGQRGQSSLPESFHNSCPRLFSRGALHRPGSVAGILP